MIDINWIVEHREKFEQAMQKRNLTLNVDEILELHQKRKKKMFEFDTMASEKNKLAK